MPDPPGQVKPGETPKNEAYLFAHMIEGDYGRLYYSVSLDGLHWTPLNGGKRVFEEYHGHADICRGPDGRYYLVGNRGDDKPDINFWVSDDLINWQKFSDYTPGLKSIPNCTNILMRIGAPKLFFDDASRQFVLTWHTTHDLGKTDLPEPYWAGQRTIYVTSKDLKIFSAPPRGCLKIGTWRPLMLSFVARAASITRSSRTNVIPRWNGRRARRSAFAVPRICSGLTANPDHPSVQDFARRRR